MKCWLLILVGTFLSFSMAIESAEAKRLGGSRSIGSQRQIAPQQPAATPARPAQQDAAGTARSPNAAATTPRSGMSRWLGPLTGLAIGLGLASLFGEQMGSLILVALIALAVVAVLRVLLRSRAPQAPMQTPQAMSYQSYGRETDAPPHLSSSAGKPDLHAQFSPAIPQDFDVDAFLAQAKRNFLTLQSANDRGDLESLREMMSDGLYDNIKQDIEARASVQQTDVVTLDAQLLEVLTEDGIHWASIRFSGMLREEVSGTATRFEEIWNLQKPEHGHSGWVLAGIQQMA